MQKIIYYLALMLAITIVLPLAIVKSCNFKPDDSRVEQEGIKVKVYIYQEKTVKEMVLEEYIKGVIAAEMPAGFEPEALKAQAVAARTYAYARMIKMYRGKDDLHNDADVCTDPGHCQAWISREKAMRMWGIFAAHEYWNKISRAVNETRNIIIEYNGSVINPVFHSNSGGRTENAEDVWEGGSVPYLKSVLSEGENAGSEFKKTITFKTDDFVNKLKGAFPDIRFKGKDILKDIGILEHTDAGRVKTIRTGNISLKGADFRKIFSLKSANFVIEKGDRNTIKITTTGNGHGVGMSQRGANYLAKNGAGYDEIIKYYYSGVTLSTIENPEKGTGY